VLDATADLMDENDVAKPFIEQCLEDADAVTPITEIAAAAQKWLGGGLTVGFNGHTEDTRLDQIMSGVKARWSYGRKRINGEQVRGLIGVRVRPAS
jgi:vacuolar-type H+-ATPase subunit E/Vma4